MQADQSWVPEGTSGLLALRACLNLPLLTLPVALGGAFPPQEPQLGGY